MVVVAAGGLLLAGLALEVTLGLLAVIVALQVLYTTRHYVFTLNRLFHTQPSLYAAIDSGDWPHVTVFIAAHNEEAVLSGCIEALLKADYPADRLCIMPVNDRSTDGTRAIIDRYVARHPGRLTPFHRENGPPGKAAALADATDLVVVRGDSSLIVVFDADYLPEPQLLKQLVAPFFDPEVGAVMGRVVPQNAGTNLLTRLLDLERSGGYQVDQQARYNLGAVAQYGGTVGGVRLAALADAGGWRPDVLAEDTDLTFRLLIKGWQTAYLGYAECHEEVPENWSVRFKQISRWAKGHNQVLAKQLWPMLSQGGLHWTSRVDGVALLGVFLMSPLLALGWLATSALVLFGSDLGINANLAIWLFIGAASFACLGNFAAFFEVAAAVHLDGSRQRLRLMPFLLVGFLVSVVAVTKATLDGFVLDRLLRRTFTWDKTVRYRQALPPVEGPLAP
ncbi:glycosyl transferase family 2 [Comamonas serinivorans]|uniref:Glycosyl transferase family 2 n=2 Tax=Comamonas serinivorans TaxID=1082851 RepID=A0A1Y0ENU0_9BURK|nr:glycosyl transferase family 2 [Comamonas serinivorans]